MQRLILMRHAKAERQSDSGQDFDRPLSPRGRVQAAAMGGVLAGAGLTPTAALVSAARRTQETWGLAEQAFPGVPATIDRALYNTSWLSMLEMIQARETETLLVVGHNPTVHELALALLRDGSASAAVIAKVQSQFPPATAAAFTFDAAGRPSYDGFFLAAEHGADGREAEEL